MEAKLVPHLLTMTAARHPDCLAVVDDSRSVSYEELVRLAGRFARGLMAAGLRTGDRFAIQLPNSVEWSAAYWGAAMAGCIIVPINTRYKPPEVAFMIGKCEASALLTADDTDASGLNVRVFRSGEIPALMASGESVSEDHRKDRLKGVRPEDIHLIQFTSGTTGYPKGAMLAHEGLVANAGALLSVWKVNAGEAMLVPGPLCHILGLATSCVLVLAAGTLLTVSHFTPERVMELVHRYQAVGIGATPTHYLMIVEHAERPRYDMSSLRFAMYGGAAFTPEVARRITADLGVKVLMAGFGMSETCGGVTSIVEGDALEAQAATLGRPLSTFEVKVVDLDTSQEVPQGEVGELWVRGVPVMKGYYREPEETEKALMKDGWFRTGDLFSRDAAGYLYFSGRLKELIKVGGYSVYPAEIERVLTEHPAIADAAVVGIPHARLGEIPFAFVRLRPGTKTTAGELEAFCQEQMASYKAPRLFEFMDAFPLSGSGKVEKFKLREKAAALADEAVR